MNDLPKKDTYLALLILGFVLGLIWGLLSWGPYKKLKEAIEIGDSDEAWANAKKIRTYVIIGAVINVLLFLGNMA